MPRQLECLTGDAEPGWLGENGYINRTETHQRPENLLSLQSGTIEIPLSLIVPTWCGSSPTLKLGIIPPRRE